MNPLIPPVCPSCQDDNTIQQGLDIISRFFRFSAPAFNFWGLLHKVLCNVFFRPLFFRPLLANGSGGRFLVVEAAVDIHMLMKGAPRSSPAVGVGPQQTQTVQRSAGLEGPPPRRTRVPKGLEKTGDTCSLSVTAQLGSPWSSILSALLLVELLFFGEHSREKNYLQTIWWDIFQIWIHTFFGLIVSVVKGNWSNKKHLHGVTLTQKENGRITLSLLFVAFMKSLV